MSAKDEQIMLALLTNGSVTEASREIGISTHTIYKRLADVEFKAEHEARRAQILNDAVNTLQSTLTKAVQAIRDIIEDANNAPQVRLNAAALILQNCLKYTEQINIIARLEELEKLTERND